MKSAPTNSDADLDEFFASAIHRRMVRHPADLKQSYSGWWLREKPGKELVWYSAIMRVEMPIFEKMVELNLIDKSGKLL